MNFFRISIYPVYSKCMKDKMTSPHPALDKMTPMLLYTINKSQSTFTYKGGDTMLFSWLPEFFKKQPYMTIVVKKNPGLKHSDCNGGSITLTIDRKARKSTVSCARCGAKAEFDPIYERLIGYTMEDGKHRTITIHRYRDKPVKGRILLIAH